jgi:hypothetical protein
MGTAKAQIKKIEELSSGSVTRRKSCAVQVALKCWTSIRDKVEGKQKPCHEILRRQKKRQDVVTVTDMGHHYGDVNVLNLNFLCLGVTKWLCRSERFGKSTLSGCLVKQSNRPRDGTIW